MISRRLILNFAESRPTDRSHPPGDSIFSELNWADIWADLSFYWSERAETFRADPNKTHDKIQIKNKMSNPSQEPPASSKAPNEDLKDMDVLCTFKIKIESQNSEYGCTKDQWPYPNQYQDAKPKIGTPSILQSPKSGNKGLRCSLHLQNEDREAKFGIWVYQWQVTISKSRSRFQTPVRNLQPPLKPQIMT